MSSTDERKIPKIVLKIGRTESNSISQETEQQQQQQQQQQQNKQNFNSIFSTRVSEMSKEFYKTGEGSITMLSLLKKINQNSYKSLENVLEL